VFKEQSTPLMQIPEQLGFVLDSTSLDSALDRSNSDVRKLLRYIDSPFFKWIRSPVAVKHGILGNVPPYAGVIGEDGLPDRTCIDGKTWFFGYDANFVTQMTREMHEKDFEGGTEPVLPFFIYLTLSSYEDDYHLFVTEMDLLLDNRAWLRRLGKRANIVTAKEALEIVELYSKRRGAYYISPPLMANEGHWYWLSFRSKVPHYNVSTSILGAFASRFIYLLMSLDEIGIQFYSGVDNDTFLKTNYYFNYFLTLIPGILDSLAIETRDRLKISFNGDDIPSRTSLSGNVGRGFLRALRDKDPALRKHINDYVDFINLIYVLRDLVVHREALRGGGLEASSQDFEWETNVVEISDSAASLIKSCGDMETRDRRVTQWGVYRFSTKFLLVPYYFTKMATKKLIDFSNKYLEILGFQNFVQSLVDKDDFLADIKSFESTR